MCFCVYEAQIVPESVSNTTDLRQLLLPVVEQFSSDTVQLSLTIESDLLDDNEQYSANITTNDDGSVNFIGTVEYSKMIIATGFKIHCALLL